MHHLDSFISSELPQCLANDVVLEPLVCRWHAYQYLLPPIQTALNLANRQLPMLDSFVRAPTPHIQASNDKALYGGAFVDLTDDDIPAVKLLIAETREKASAWLTLASDLKKLNSDLRSQAKGASLDHLYGSLPPSLEGVVEFMYDVNNDPRFRIREALLYDGALRGHTLQELMLYRPTAKCNRKFFLNTPRLDGPNNLSLNIAFNDEIVDEIIKSRIVPTDVQALAQKIGLSSTDQMRFRSYFTNETPRRNEPNYNGSAVRVRCFGHACVLLQTNDVSILLDPTFAYEHSDQSTSLTFSDLPDRIDYLIISHAHQDHFNVEALLHLRSRTSKVLVPRNNAGSVADPSLKLTLNHLGFHDVQAMDDLDSINCPDGQITSLPFPGEHSELDIFSKQAIGISLLGKQFVFLVDSDAVDAALYRRIASRFLDIDALFIGMECNGAPLTWLYGPLLLRPVSRADDQTRRGRGSNSQRAWSIVEALRPKHAYIYAMGMELWNRHLLGLEYPPDSIQISESDDFIARCRAADIQSARLSGCQTFYF